MRKLLYTITVVVLTSGCSSFEDNYPSYEDIEVLMTKSENEIVQHMSEKGWKDYHTEIEYYSPRGVRLFHDDKNHNGKVDVSLGELSPSTDADYFKYEYKGDYNGFFYTSMGKHIKRDTTDEYLTFRLKTQENDPSQREMYFSESDGMTNRVNSFGLTKCLKRNALYDDKYFIDKTNYGVYVYKTQSEFAQSILKSEKKGNF